MAIDVRRLLGSSVQVDRVVLDVDTVRVAPPERETAPAPVPELLPAPHPPRFRRTRAWFVAHRKSIGIVSVLLVAVGVVHAWGMTHSPAPIDDEGTYLAQAFAVQKWGTLSHYTYIYDHTPVGWMLLALWTWVTGAFDKTGPSVLAGREFILACNLVSSTLVYMVARRLGLNRLFASLALLLFAFAPVAVKFHRFVNLDNIATPFILGAFLLALSHRRHLAATVGSALLFATSLLIKETSLFALPPLLYLLWQRADPRTRRLSVALWATVLVSAVGLYAAYAMLKGELFPGPGHTSLLGSIWWNVFDREAAASAVHANSVNRQLMNTWLADDSVLVLYTALVLPTAYFVRSLRPLVVGLVFIFLASLRAYYLPMAFIILPLSLAPIVVAGVANEAWGGIKKAWRRRSGERFRVGLLARRLVAVVGVVALLAGGASVAFRWSEGNATVLRDRQADHFFAAGRWMQANLPRQSRIVVEDFYWVDLVQAGWRPDDVIWHEKIESDPEVKHHIPRGWRDLDYVVSSAGMRSRLDAVPLPTVKAAIEHSTVVASFGLGGDVVEVRRVNDS